MNKARNDKAAHAMADQADSLETDVYAIVCEDDIMACLSHLEILERRVATLKQSLRDTLEGK